jgi:hypothetical protein
MADKETLSHHFTQHSAKEVEPGRRSGTNWEMCQNCNLEALPDKLRKVIGDRHWSFRSNKPKDKTAEIPCDPEWIPVWPGWELES